MTALLTRFGYVTNGNYEDTDDNIKFLDHVDDEDDILNGSSQATSCDNIRLPDHTDGTCNDSSIGTDFCQQTSFEGSESVVHSDTDVVMHSINDDPVQHSHVEGVIH